MGKIFNRNYLQRVVQSQSPSTQFLEANQRVKRGELNFLGGMVHSHLGTEPAPLSHAGQLEQELQAKKASKAAMEQKIAATEDKVQKLSTLRTNQKMLKKMVQRDPSLQPKLDNLLRQISELEITS